MLESFYILQHPERVDTQWRKKLLLSSEIMGQESLRQMRPELAGDRTRLDLMWYQNKLGLRGPSDDSQNFSFFEIPSAPDTCHSTLNEMIEQFKNSSPPALLDMAQLRFRCFEDERRGLWIDCSNLIIKALLDEKVWFTHLLKNLRWHVELGQKQKEVTIEGHEIHFKEATPRVWLSSYDLNNNALPLVCYISSFSQPGAEANRALMAAGLDLLDSCDSKPKGFCEWGAGYGNLTACYSSSFKTSNWASELDIPAVECLKINHKHFSHTQIERQVAGNGLFPAHDLWLLDPPRSGFPELLKKLPGLNDKPTYILIYHCHHKGLLGDSRLLKAAQYKLKEWSSVDIFPATPHHEVISLWKIS